MWQKPVLFIMTGLEDRLMLHLNHIYLSWKDTKDYTQKNTRISQKWPEGLYGPSFIF